MISFTLLVAIIVSSFVACALLSDMKELGRRLIDIKKLHEMELDPLLMTHSTGYLRTDTYDWLNGVRLGSVIVPVGICIETETENAVQGSYVLVSVLDSQNGQLVAHKRFYTSDDCTGYGQDVFHMVFNTETIHQLDISTMHVLAYADATATLALQSSSLLVK